MITELNSDDSASVVVVDLVSIELGGGGRSFFFFLILFFLFSFFFTISYYSFSILIKNNGMTIFPYEFAG